MLDLSFDELERYIDEISTGSKLIEVESGDQEISVLLFLQPQTNDRLAASLIYRQTYNEAVRQELPTHAQMKELLTDRGILKEEDEAKIRVMQGKLEGQRAVLAKTTKVRANKERVLNIIKGLEQELRDLIWQREQNFGLTAEAKANEDKLAFLCRRYVYKSKDELLWSTEEDYNVCKDHTFRMNVFAEYASFVTGLSTTVVRYVARSNLWRIKYVTSMKCGCDLFGIPAVDFSTDMTNLLYWSHFYQNIYEMIEDQPTEDIIEDDSALDAYMENYYKELKNRRLTSSGGSGTKIDAMQSEQVIVTPAHELHKDIEYDKPREAQRLKDRETMEVKDRSPRKKRKRNVD